MAVRFDATADRLTRATNTPNYNSVYSWAGWFYITDVTGNRALFSVGVDSFFANYDEWRCAFGTLGCKNNVSEVTSAGGALASTTWTHIAGVRESATSQKGYVNGVLVATNTSNVGTGRTAPTRMELGGFTSSDQDLFDGRIADFKCWDAALTIDEILAERWPLAPAQFTNLNTFSPFWPGATERVRNYGVNAGWTAAGTLTDEDGPPIQWTPRSYQLYALASGGTVYTDTGSAVSGATGSGADALTASDAGQSTAILIGSGADARTTDDAGVAASTLTGSGADAVTFADAGLATSMLTGSGADARTAVDTGAGVAALFGSGAGVAILVDSGTGVLIAVGSGSDVQPGEAIICARAVLNRQAKSSAALLHWSKPTAQIAPAARTATLAQAAKPRAVLARTVKPIATLEPC